MVDVLKNTMAGDKKRGLRPPFLCDDPLALLGEEVDKEVVAEVVGGGVEGPAAVDLGDLLDKLQQRGFLAEHEDVQVDAAGGTLFKFQKGPGQRFGISLRPSPYIGRVGIHNFTFEACSRFTLVTARRFAARPWRTSVPRASAGRSPCPTVQVATEMNRQLLGRNFHPLASCIFVAHLYIVVWIFRQKLRFLLSLSKKSKWPILIILAPLKINNLHATENGKMPRFKVFRQSRYVT